MVLIKLVKTQDNTLLCRVINIIRRVFVVGRSCDLARYTDLAYGQHSPASEIYKRLIQYNTFTDDRYYIKVKLCSKQVWHL